MVGDPDGMGCALGCRRRKTNGPQAGIGGDAASARAALAEAVRNRPQDVTAPSEYAEFLDRYGDPGAREAYKKLLAELSRAGD